MKRVNGRAGGARWGLARRPAPAPVPAGEGAAQEWEAGTLASRAPPTARYTQLLPNTHLMVVEQEVPQCLVEVELDPLQDLCAEAIKPKHVRKDN